MSYSVALPHLSNNIQYGYSVNKFLNHNYTSPQGFPQSHNFYNPYDQSEVENLVTTNLNSRLPNKKLDNVRRIPFKSKGKPTPAFGEPDQTFSTEDLDYQAEKEFQDFKDSKTLGAIVALLGLSGLFLPLLSIASMPFDLLNPNIFIAKSLALLSIPVAYFSYGRRRKRSLDLEMDNIFRNIINFTDTLHLWDSNKETRPSKSIVNKHNVKQRSLFIIQRVESQPTSQNVTETGDVESNEEQQMSNPKPVQMLQPKPEDEREQCMERIVCEGLLNSLPQLFIRSVLRGQESMLRNLRSQWNWDWSQVDEHQMHRQYQDILATRRKGTKLNKRKNLAKYALGKIQNNSNGGGASIKNKNKNTFNSNNLLLNARIPSVNVAVGPITSNNRIKPTTKNCSVYKCSLML